MKSIKDIEFLEGVKVLVRVDFNVPVQNEMVADDYRLKAALPTIEYLSRKGARVILMSHLESSEGENRSLNIVADYLTRKLNIKVGFVGGLRDAHQFIENVMKNGDVILLENLRNYEGEKKNDAKFGQELASLGDIYVNEAFPVSHRKHASVVRVPEYIPSYAGFQFEKEVDNLSKVFHPAHPFLFILNGAKFETKLPLLSKFIHSADKIFIGGALSSDFFRGKGWEVGHSVVSSGNVDLSSYLHNEKILLPTDVVNEDGRVYESSSFLANGKIVDVGPNTMKILEKAVSEAAFILWNGPLGLYQDGFEKTTEALARMIAGSKALSIVGGGDTVAVIGKLGNEKDFTFVSTGGGAMLDFLAEETLPGIEALNKAAEA